MSKVSIAALDVTNRVKNVLIRNGINTIEELVEKSIDELVAIKGLELLTVLDIAKEVYKNGYKFNGVLDIASYKQDVISKHKEKTAGILKRMITNATPMPVFDEQTFSLLMEEIYDKNIKSINPLSENETYYFREYLGINQVLYEDGEIVKLDPVYRVNKITVRNMSIIRIIYTRFDNNELENQFIDTKAKFNKPIFINGTKIESYEDFSKITSMDFYEALFESTARFKFYLEYKKIHDQGIYFYDEITEVPKKEVIEEKILAQEITQEKYKLERLQERLNQSILLKKLLIQLLEETDEEIKSITNDISNIKPKM